ncbi:protein tyrosine phosphatase [Planotetraspora sp. A-T 1434]|uniref:protein-tyrosine phosphatase family protein n=1 Tax=Planotetraspora sp. A-T 1434 TaxID=2979219 RepID=UPI0021BFC7CB|nr:protein-tyrosine phosphatase family protein [Planotetraspora sp. A-T 1434]MCT9931273.1 protein tyrosine phosphatase [Planotetraspora sp. A-T 1434]
MAALLTGAIEMPDGIWVRGRGLRAPAPDGPLPQFGLYLGSARLRRRHDATLEWPHEWVRWPDFLLPLDWNAAAASIVDLRERARMERRVEVACNGGVGRTGTVMACLATLAGLPPGEAVAWVREHYNHRAVETPWQRRWVTWFSTNRPSDL